MTDKQDHPHWIDASGPDSDVVISTRARLARNLDGIPFPQRATREDLLMVAREARAASVRLAERFPRLRAIDVEKLTPEQRSYLLDAHIASSEQVMGGEGPGTKASPPLGGGEGTKVSPLFPEEGSGVRSGRLVILEPSGMLAILVNEEDHLRLQAILSGLAPKEAYELVDWADDVLAANMRFGYSDRLGYLTASVSNVGTGLRVSALMHLGALAMLGNLRKPLRAAYDLGVAVRGAFGEGSQPAGDIFQVSNEMTLGLSEVEIVQKVQGVAQYLLGEERQARKELLSAGRKRLLESASKSLRVLSSSMGTNPQRALALMSPLRLVAEAGLVEGCTLSLMNELMLGLRVGAGDEGRANISRATLLRRKLDGVRIRGL